MRNQIIREQVSELIRARPFKSFVLFLENGQQVPIDHPENIAFQPESQGEWTDFMYMALSRGRTFWGSFDAVSAVAIVDSTKAA